MSPLVTEIGAWIGLISGICAILGFSGNTIWNVFRENKKRIALDVADKLMSERMQSEMSRQDHTIQLSRKIIDGLNEKLAIINRLDIEGEYDMLALGAGINKLPCDGCVNIDPQVASLQKIVESINIRRAKRILVQAGQQ